MIIWITGLSGAGKTTLAKTLYKDLKKKIPNTLWIDGDNLRKHFQNTKKYDQKSRIEQYKKMIRLAKFCYDQKINIIVSVFFLFFRPVIVLFHFFCSFVVFGAQ